MVHSLFVCALGAIQGWSRVSNNHSLCDTKDFNMYDSSIVLVGPYTYTPEDYNSKNTVHIYARLSNGELVEAFNGILKG